MKECKAWIAGVAGTKLTPDEVAFSVTKSLGVSFSLHAMWRALNRLQS